MLIPLALFIFVLVLGGFARGSFIWGRCKLPGGRGDRTGARAVSFGALFLCVMLGISMGWGFSTLSESPFPKVVVRDAVSRDAALPVAVLPVAAQTAPPSQAPYTTVDFVPQRYQRGQSLYLKNCATCHIAVPPQVLPSETWRNLIQDQSHYGAELEPLREPSRGLIWSYLRYSSRQKSNREERTPYRIDKSQYFRALHPRVDLPRPTSLDTCASCHPAAPNFNFRQLTLDWVKTP